MALMWALHGLYMILSKKKRKKEKFVPWTVEKEYKLAYTYIYNLRANEYKIKPYTPWVSYFM